MIAVGTQQGIWMGIEGDTNTIKLVLSISDVTQIAVLEDHHILLILAGKYARIYYTTYTDDDQIKLCMPMHWIPLFQKILVERL